jgi:hypothetical protein
MKLHKLTPEENQALVHIYWYKQATERQRILAAGALERSEENISTVLGQGNFDLYLATSMRTEEQYLAAIKMHEWLSSMGKTVFAPVFMTSTSRLGQSDLEAFALENSRGIVGVCGLTDTYGRDSEVADMLTQAKPSFLYLEPQKDLASQKTQDERYNVFKNVHPRTLIAPRRHSMMHGSHVTKDLVVLRGCIEEEERISKKLQTPAEYREHIMSIDGRTAYVCGSCESITRAQRKL